VVYVVLARIETIPSHPPERLKILEVIRRMWDSKRCKLLLSIRNDFYPSFLKDLKKTLPELGSKAFEITPNGEDIKTYILSRLEEGPHFMMEKATQSEIMEDLIKK